MLPGSEVFRKEYVKGFFGTHSCGRYRLLVKDGRKWKPVWDGIAGWPLFAWGDAVLFAAVINESGEVAYLLHVRGGGTANIHAEVRSYRLIALGNQKSATMIEGRTRWLVASNDVTWIAEADSGATEPVKVQIKVEQLLDMAKKVRERNFKRTFHGNGFFDAKQAAAVVLGEPHVARQLPAALRSQCVASS